MRRPPTDRPFTVHPSTVHPSTFQVQETGHEAIIHRYVGRLARSAPRLHWRCVARARRPEAQRGDHRRRRPRLRGSGLPRLRDRHALHRRPGGWGHGAPPLLCRAHLLAHSRRPDDGPRPHPFGCLLWRDPALGQWWRAHQRALHARELPGGGLPDGHRRQVAPGALPAGPDPQCPRLRPLLRPPAHRGGLLPALRERGRQGLPAQREVRRRGGLRDLPAGQGSCQLDRVSRQGEALLSLCALPRAPRAPRRSRGAGREVRRAEGREAAGAQPLGQAVPRGENDRAQEPASPLCRDRGGHGPGHRPDSDCPRSREDRRRDHRPLLLGQRRDPGLWPGRGRQLPPARRQGGDLRGRHSPRSSTR